ncbi:hypothetical protein A3Q56_05271 [Intoshia linei]|uniref:Uncharacterized protein n=1 Tax=Intoshia linei TaxID=1819745 RepID=A0A177AYR9_9BILA|nr:hypothetical protein A3Q56_05271 [Intoshia linei]
MHIIQTLLRILERNENLINNLAESKPMRLAARITANTFINVKNKMDSMKNENIIEDVKKYFKK